MIKKIDFGSGRVETKGFINYDKDDIDLNKKINIDDDSVDEIRLHHVLEHLNNPYGAIMELHRILKIGGILDIKLPQFACVLPHQRFFHSRYYFNCITKDFKSNCRQHKHLFSEKSFKYKFTGIKRDFPFIKFDLRFILKKIEK